jgi:O-acetyl-ADP-ribose deacetylase (regulator of RNase III)
VKVTAISFSIIQNDITKINVDAIVNAANPNLQMGGGVCGAIFSAAGADRLQAACDNLAPIKVGEAVITQGFKLSAKFIIHAAGPVYKDGKSGEEELLRACYNNSLELAVKHGCKSVAFPLLSSGVYGYPTEDALRVATGAIRDFISDHDIDVSLVVFDRETLADSEKIMGANK